MARESVFRFKQFSVKNHKSAMKVGTDGVLLGAWCDTETSERVLDIGTGTGLIALMVAQRSSADIDAVEIDIDAVDEAKENFEASPWAERLRVINEDIKVFTERNGANKYDLIVSNPPFFTNGIISPDKQRASARHTNDLDYSQLMSCCSLLLADSGAVCLITPYDVCDELIEIAANVGLYPCKITNVIPVPDAEVKRVLWKFEKNKKEVEVNSIVIEESRHIYTQDYIQLTKEFYLKM